MNTLTTGYYSLIQYCPDRMRLEAANIIRDVLTKAAQGNLIYKHPDQEDGERQLVIVAAFGRVAEAHRQQVETVLRDHHVDFVPDSAIGDLERQIAETAH